MTNTNNQDEIEKLLESTIYEYRYEEFTDLVTYYKDKINCSWLIQCVHFNSNHEYFDFLFNLDCIDKTWNNDFTLRIASQKGDTYIVKKLLSLPQTNPSNSRNLPLVWAAENEYYEVIELILNDKRFRPCEHALKSFNFAYHYEDKKILNLLLSNKLLTKKLKHMNSNFYNKILKTNLKNKIKEF